MEKIVLPGERVTTVTLDGSECAVKFSRPFKAFSIRNDGDTDVCIALESGKSAGDDGVICVSAGASDTYFHGRQLDTCYLFGDAGGKVQVKAQDTDTNSFRKKGKGGVIDIPTLEAGNNITLTPDSTSNKITISSDAINDNLLINPDFKINQRGVSGTFSEAGKYFVDRWRLESGSVTINADGTLTLNGTMVRVFENPVGTNVTASSDGGTTSYNDSTKTFTVTGNGDVIRWAKLEYGDTATPFIPPDPATELLKCQRYYCVGRVQTTGGALSGDSYMILPYITFPQTMRCAPTVQLMSVLGTMNTLSNWNNMLDSNISGVIVNGANVTHDGFGSLVSDTHAFAGVTESNFFVFKYAADAEIY